jgi:hypothetical protein
LKRALVVGWYGHGNVGDETFRLAFEELWGSLADFTFVDQVPADVNERFDAVMIGGGSLMDHNIPSLIDPQHITIPIGLIGVGIHSYLHPSPARWIKQAKVVVVRNQSPLNPPGAIVAPDLFFACQWPVPGPPPAPTPGYLLVLGNDFVMTRRDSPAWQVAAWDWFKGELAHTLDQHFGGMPVIFAPMCTGPGMTMGPDDDRLFAAEIVAQMGARDRVTMLSDPADLQTLSGLITGADLIVTLRFHGAVLAAILEAPFVGISMHDKMRSFFEQNDMPNWTDYYGFTGTRLLDALEISPTRTELATLRDQGNAAWQRTSRRVATALQLG